MLTIRPTEHVKAPCERHPGEDSIRQELERVLESDAFKATPRRKKLLRYLVEEFLANGGRELKGYTIATIVFGRDDSFDPQTDPVVRLEARRLRHDLDGYYVSAGRGNPLRISIPKGQYAPSIEWGEDVSDVSLPPSVTVDERADQPVPERKVEARSPDLLHRAAITATVAILLMLAFVAYGMLQIKAVSADADATTNGTALAILPFEVDGDNPANTLLARGMAGEITNSINKFGGFRLYMPSGGDRNFSGSDPIEVGKQLKLSYVVNGTIDAAAEDGSGGGMLRVNARLIDVQSQRILWIGSYDRTYSPSSLRAVQREIATSVASALGQPYGVLRTSETEKTATLSASEMSSYECVLRAYDYRRSFRKGEHENTMACLDQVTRRDPGYAEAWAMLAWLHMDEGRFGWAADGDPDRAFRQALATARHAFTLDHDNVSALKALASTLHYMGQYSESERYQRQALAINPNDPDTLAQLGWRLAVRGRFEEGIPFLEQAIEHSVNPPGWYYHLIAIDQYLRGRYEEMLGTAQRSTADGSGISWSLVAIAEGAVGQQGEAGKALAKMAEISPLLSRDPAQAYRRHQAIDSIVDSLVSGLRKAGWREQSTSVKPAG